MVKLIVTTAEQKTVEFDCIFASETQDGTFMIRYESDDTIVQIIETFNENLGMILRENVVRGDRKIEGYTRVTMVSISGRQITITLSKSDT